MPSHCSHMGTAESKFSPQIVAGSYIGWQGATSSAPGASTTGSATPG